MAYNARMKFEIVYRRIAQSLLIVGPLASLAISPLTNYDPINLIKLLFVVPLAFFAIALIASSFKYSITRLDNAFWVSTGLFVLAMISSILFSGARLTQQIWGTFGRGTGFVTYFSLLGILISTALIQKTDFYHKLMNSIVITAIPMTAYALIQEAERHIPELGIKDPFGWSEKNVFGTFGNINFLSAFFGLSSIVGTLLLLEKKLSIGLRISIALMVFLDMAIILDTGSIQGVMIYAIAMSIAIYLFLRSKAKLRILRIPYTLVVLFGSVFTLMGLSNKGPLSKFLFAPSIVFRTDYWHAGWKMTMEHPIVGVGIDSYGEWYRSSRGLISTIRTGPERVSNTAHNIFLDFSSGGGFPLLIAYLAINVIALRAAIRVLKRNTEFVPYFVALFTTWVAFLVFSAVSINQIGVGIWGWLITGALIGYEISTRGESGLSKNSSNSKRKVSAVLPPGAGAIGFLGAIVGFILAFIPFNADMKYKAATQIGAMDKIIESTKVFGSSTYYTEIALDTAIRNNFTAQADELTRQLIKMEPRSFMGWKAVWAITTTTPEEKQLAVQKLSELDPFNPGLKDLLP